MKKRNSLEIVAEILNLCKNPQTKTRIMHNVVLSWKVLQRYLSYLQSKGFLQLHRSSTKYITTLKGLAFVKKWEELMEVL